MSRILLDESLPRQLVNVLADLEIATVFEAGWAGKSNGELLELARDRFDVLLTGDRTFVSSRISPTTRSVWSSRPDGAQS